MTIDRREGITRHLYRPTGESRRQNLKRQLIQRKGFEGKNCQRDRPILATRLPPIFVWGAL
ncbi:hypothetical protein QUA71_25880 [Microcoleus sp. MON1_C5]|uniref:hypothetical protein n=1 Tax=Microcoleus sp. MON1_C5 TaxID=2818828 RepID=UPI002FD0CFDF